MFLPYIPTIFPEQGIQITLIIVLHNRTYDYASGYYYLKTQQGTIYDSGKITDGITKSIGTYSPGIFFIDKNVTVKDNSSSRMGTIVVIHPDNTFTKIAKGGSLNCVKGDIVLGNETDIKITYR